MNGETPKLPDLKPELKPEFTRGIEINFPIGRGIKGWGKPDVAVIPGLGITKGKFSTHLKGFAAIGVAGHSLNATVKGSVTLQMEMTELNGYDITGITTSGTLKKCD